MKIGVQGEKNQGAINKMANKEAFLLNQKSTVSHIRTTHINYGGSYEFSVICSC